MHTHQPRVERHYTPSERPTMSYRTWKEKENAGTRILVKGMLCDGNIRNQPERVHRRSDEC